MLKRIHKIKNIGRFIDCNASGKEFAENTIVFGLNTKGKSTLTAIFRSLKTGNSDLLIGRKTLGSNNPKDVDIDFEDNGVVDKYFFRNRAWNKSHDNLIIFDSKFIAENVFDGESITFDQQKNLNTVIIGKRGQELNSEIIGLQNKSEEYSNKKREKTNEFSRHFPLINIEEFRYLQEDLLIDDKIKEKEKEIKFEKDKDEIRKIIKLHIQNISLINFSIKSTLEKTLDLKQEEIEKHIKANLSSEKNARNFIKEGLDLLKAKPIDGAKRVCVFCGQDLEKDSEDLIKLYSEFFRGGYEQLQNEIVRSIDYFKNINIEAILTKIIASLKSIDVDIEFDDVVIEKISELKKEFEEELSKKRDLNYVINFNSFDNLQTLITQIKKSLENIERTKINITPLKNLSELEREKRSFEYIKARHTEAWKKFFDELLAIETAAEIVRTKRDELRKELETYSLEIFNTHRGAINKFCADMGADFEIDDFKPLKKIIGTSERIFALKFFGTHKISIDNSSDKEPSFKNTLSESDKRLLAFAFFLSILSHDNELDKKIVIFDDPMSSFDSERRRKTIQLVTDVSFKFKNAKGEDEYLRPKQKIILTHEESFAKKLSKTLCGACMLKIEEYVDESGQKRSRIAHANFDQEYPDDDISSRTENIKNILDRREFNRSFEHDCRIVLEHIFKRKYCLDLKEEIEKNKSIRTFTGTLNEKKINNFDVAEKFQRFSRLCDDLNIELHDNATTNSSGDKESILKDFFVCIKEI